jgi:hypothetical protein
MHIQTITLNTHAQVLEEEELSAMRSHQEHFEQIRNAELVATQRMEAAEKRKIEEKERRLAQVCVCVCMCVCVVCVCVCVCVCENTV